MTAQNQQNFLQIPFLDVVEAEETGLTGGQPILVKKEPKVRDLGYVADKYKDKEAPESFQRPESWSKVDFKKYLNSILMDRIEGSIVVVNIDSCMHRLQQVAPNDRALQLFLALKENDRKYIVLDGNNRLSFMIRLVTGNYTIPEGEYFYIRDPQDTSVSTFRVKRGKDKFSDLPPVVQDVILGRAVVISEYSQIGYDGLSEVFLNTNSGVFPNGQEIRNSFNSPWADYVRVLRSQCEDLLGFMFSDFRKRYIGDEWIAQTLDFCLQAVDDSELNEELQIGVQFNAVTSSTMNNLYRSTFLSVKDQVKYRDNFLTLMDWITQMVDEADDATKIKAIKRKTTVQNLFFMITHGIKTYEQAVAAVQLMDDEYKSGNAIIDDITYKNSCEGFRKVNVEIRYKILTQIIDEVLN
jgi:hypothetical protein